MLKGLRITSESLRTLALFSAAPVFGGLLVWQLYTLEPERVCKTSFEMAKVDGAGIIAAFQACIGLMAKVIDAKDHAIIGLLTVLGLGYIMMLMRELRLQGGVSGPLGTGINITPSNETTAAVAGAAAGAVAGAAAATEQKK